MIISESAVSMSANHRYSQSEFMETRTVELQDSEQYMKDVRALAETNGKSLVESMRDYETQQNEDRQKQNNQNMMRSMLEYMDRMRETDMQNMWDPQVEEDMQIKLLRNLLSALNGKVRMDPAELQGLRHGGVLDLRSKSIKNAELAAGIRGEKTADGTQGMRVVGGASSSISLREIGIDVKDLPTIGTRTSGTTWHRITATSGFYSEAEYTSFESKGLVKTQDGRDISFNIEVSMSRAFMKSVEVFKDETYIRTDPLIINLDTDRASLSDVKFRFDLDGDGKTEKISFAGEGSGFLALDKDGNGKIDNGTELFGTQNGDGFADLAAYDSDGNNWIDENDEIFSRLRVWIRDHDGNDKLLTLSDADVGAIYLGNTNTEFSLKDDSHITNGIIQKTGVYLKESGGVGTVNHVDLTM